MERIGERIRLWEGEETVIEISGRVARWKEALLLFWALLWTFCGMIILYELLWSDYMRETKLLFFIYLCFWSYFEYRSVKTFIWRKWGKELIKVTGEVMLIKRDVGSYGRLFSYYLVNVKNLEKINISDQSFSKTYNHSFWTTGGETLCFEYLGKKITFGMQLSDRDADELLKSITREIRRKA